MMTVNWDHKGLPNDSTDSDEIGNHLTNIAVPDADKRSVNYHIRSIREIENNESNPLQGLTMGPESVMMEYSFILPKEDEKQVMGSNMKILAQQKTPNADI